MLTPERQYVKSDTILRYRSSDMRRFIAGESVRDAKSAFRCTKALSAIHLAQRFSEHYERRCAACSRSAVVCVVPGGR